MILIVSSEQDLHTTTVMEHLAHFNAKVRLLDFTDYPQRAQLALHYHSHFDSNYTLALPTASQVATFPFPLAECRVIWWRRPQSYEIHPEISDPSHRAFAFTECSEAFEGLWLALDSFWVNHPIRTQEGGRKAYQLKLAQRLGMDIPQTLITNSPQQAREFVDALGADRTIYKAFSATASHWRETRLLKAEEMALLDNVRFAPVIFQEYIPAEVDLRITVIGDEIFPAAIYSQESAYPVDFRMDMGMTRVEPYTLPGIVTAQLRQLMKRLGLVYGAIDMRLTPDGRFVFLEVNPAGQWLFIEQRTGQPITETFAQMLMERDQ
ncbi:MAG: alpha-L-glutamate ligase [Burkholderiales bacterium]|nr:alpha-L-glutamate ligase [Anaerolineae bacterium]